MRCRRGGGLREWPRRRVAVAVVRAGRWRRSIAGDTPGLHSTAGGRGAAETGHYAAYGVDTDGSRWQPMASQTRPAGRGPLRANRAMFGSRRAEGYLHCIAAGNVANQTCAIAEGCR